MSFKAGKIEKGKVDPSMGLPSLTQEELLYLLHIIGAHKFEGKEVEKVDEGVEIQGEQDTIVIGSKVKWTDKKNNELTGLVEKITDKSYKICCKDGKKSGDKGSLYMVSKNEVSLD